MELFCGSSPGPQPVPLGVPQLRDDLPGSLWIPTSERHGWALVKGGQGPADLKPLVGWVPEVIGQLLDRIDDPVAQDLWQTSTPNAADVLVDWLSDHHPIVGRAVQALVARSRDPMQSDWVPPIHPHSINGNPVWGYRADDAACQLRGLSEGPALRATLPATDDALVEVLLPALGVTDVGYHVIDADYLNGFPAEQVETQLAKTAARPEGSFEEVVNRLATRAWTGAEPGVRWLAWIDALDDAQLRRAGQALNMAHCDWTNPRTQVWQALVMQLLDANRTAQQRADTFARPPPVSKGHLSLWETRFQIRLPNALRYWFTRVSDTVGIPFWYDYDFPAYYLTIGAHTPVRTQNNVDLFVEHGPRIREDVWTLRPNGQIVRFADIRRSNPRPVDAPACLAFLYFDALVGHELPGPWMGES
ncbi:MAG: hypothetical protein AAGA48_07225 [Myxococcota bacterium]